MIAAIFAAAMSASAGELNALATATIIDFYRRHFVTDATDTHYLKVSKLATISWGLFASVVAMYAANQGSLIEVVNRYGSFFYGSLLGVFILAILTKRATATGAFWGLIAGMVVVLIVAFTTPIAFLWHNLIGAAVVVVVGMALSYMERPRRPERSDKSEASYPRQTLLFPRRPPPPGGCPAPPPAPRLALIPRILDRDKYVCQHAVDRH